jgi:hypothetical protein
VFGCSEKNVMRADESELYTIKSFDMESFDSQIDLKGQKLELQELYYPDLIHVQGDYIVVSETQSDTLFHILDRNDFSYLKNIGKVGVAPGEIESCSRFFKSSKNDEFWSYSITSKVISKFNISDSSILSKTQVKPKNQEMYLASSLSLSSEASFISTRNSGDEKFVEFSFDGEILETYHSWQDMLTLKDIPSNVISALFQGNFATNSGYDHYAFACLDADIIEVLHKPTGKITSIRGPIDHLPEFDVDYGAGYAMCALRLNTVKYCYLDVAMTKDKIYGLFSGHSFEEIDINNELKMCEQVFVFDLEGNPLAHYTLDQPIFHFTVDEKNQRILGITYDEDPNVVVFNL